MANPVYTVIGGIFVAEADPGNASLAKVEEIAHVALEDENSAPEKPDVTSANTDILPAPTCDPGQNTSCRSLLSPSGHSICCIICVATHIHLHTHGH